MLWYKFCLMKKSLLNSLGMLSKVIDLPTPYNISYMWNLGSLLGIVMSIQVMTGLFLVFYFIPSELEAFDSVINIMREVKFGFFMRFLHLNGASFVFLIMYCHMYKGLMNNSFMLFFSWLSGNVILLLTILVAFMGYVLPWGNMGFWAATVITSFISAIPFVGEMLLDWIWGGYSVSGRTLQFFFTLHYLMPFGILGLAVIHMLLLHNTGSSNPLGSHSSMIKVKFFPFFTSKDLLSVMLFMCVLWLLLIYPYWSSDPENFMYANRLSSPINIQPEWYFLPFYALLRSSSSKLGGLILMILGVFMFWLLPSFIMQDLKKFKLYSFLNVYLLMLALLLGWVASWGADAYMSCWLTVLVSCYFLWWFFVWFISIIVLAIFE
uniref:cytochrome b n=1 Tax=Aonchotheca putorii TaxID=1647945 RepID=UPI00237C03DF|nr:cytochrome b [Aonchotheca putorii]WBV76983.1 cytochrome b [Aonchotheca putorii]